MTIRQKQILEEITAKALNEAVALGRDKLIQISPSFGAWPLGINLSTSDGLWQFTAGACVWRSQEGISFLCAQGDAKHKYIFWKTACTKVLRLEDNGTFAQLSKEEKKDIPFY
jgi:hypothetical protein